MEQLGDFKDHEPRPPRVGTEIDYRINDGLEVTLYWEEGTDKVWVGCVDNKTGDVFIVDIPEDTKPSDVFNHPYAYRAFAEGPA